MEVIVEKMRSGVKRYLVTCSELANENYTSDFVRRLFAEEGKAHFTARCNVLGHVQEGGVPSPFDRIYGK